MVAGRWKRIPSKDSRLDLAAALLVCLALAVAALYPETFIIGIPLLGFQKAYPLTLLLPLMAAGTAIFMVARRDIIKFGSVDALVLFYAAFLLVRNITGPENLATAKYVVYGLGIYYITALLAARKESLLRLIVYTLVGLTLITVLYGLAEYAFQENVLYHKYVAETVREPRVGLHRIGSTLAHPVPYGAFLIQVLPFSVLIWARSRGTRERARRHGGHTPRGARPAVHLFQG